MQTNYGQFSRENAIPNQRLSSSAYLYWEVLWALGQGMVAEMAKPCRNSHMKEKRMWVRDNICADSLPTLWMSFTQTILHSWSVRPGSQFFLHVEPYNWDLGRQKYWCFIIYFERPKTVILYIVIPNASARHISTPLPARPLHQMRVYSVSQSILDRWRETRGTILVKSGSQKTFRVVIYTFLLLFLFFSFLLFFPLGTTVRETGDNRLGNPAACFPRTWTQRVRAYMRRTVPP